MIGADHLPGRNQAYSRCSRFDRCSASVCPLDADWRKRIYTDSDRTCAWLLEAAKPDGEAEIRGALPSDLVEVILGAIPDICARHGRIGRRLTRASSQQSKRRAGLVLSAPAEAEVAKS